MRLSRALIFVKDLPRMEAFYSAALGQKPNEETRLENWIEFGREGAGIALHAVPPDVADSIVISSPPRPREDNAIKLLFAADDLPAERIRLESLGAAIVERPWGSFDVIDPEGNVFGLISTEP